MLKKTCKNLVTLSITSVEKKQAHAVTKNYCSIFPSLPRLTPTTPGMPTTSNGPLLDIHLLVRIMVAAAAQPTYQTVWIRDDYLHL